MESGTMTSETDPVRSTHFGTMIPEMGGTTWSELPGTMMSEISTQISIPNKSSDKTTAYEKRKLRKKFRARAAIEPVIGHLKHDHRMKRNYLSGTEGDAINALLAGAALNLKMKLNQIKEEIEDIFVLIFEMIFRICNWFKISFAMKDGLFQDRLLN